MFIHTFTCVYTQYLYTGPSLSVHMHKHGRVSELNQLCVPFKSLHLMGEDVEPGDNFNQLSRGTRSQPRALPASPQATQAHCRFLERALALLPMLGGASDHMGLDPGSVLGKSSTRSHPLGRALSQTSTASSRRGRGQAFAQRVKKTRTELSSISMSGWMVEGQLGPLAALPPRPEPFPLRPGGA